MIFENIEGWTKGDLTAVTIDKEFLETLKMLIQQFGKPKYSEELRKKLGYLLERIDENLELLDDED